jgi:hypothetical protein
MPMKLRDEARAKSGSKAGAKRLALASSAAPKRISASKKSAPKKSATPKKGNTAKKPAAKKAAPAKKPAAAKPAASAAKPTPAPAAPRLATPLSASGQPLKAASPVAKPNAPPRPAGGQSAEDRRRAATRKFFARLRSLEAIVGADLRKRGSVVLMQAVDQWYSEAINANATDVSITTAAKAVIAQL